MFRRRLSSKKVLRVRQSKVCKPARRRPAAASQRKSLRRPAISVQAPKRKTAKHKSKSVARQRGHGIEAMGCCFGRGISSPMQKGEGSRVDPGENTSASKSSRRKLNVLCFHGFSMNSDKMREKCLAWEIHCADIAVFHYLTAPKELDTKDMIIANALGLPMHSDMRRWAATWKPSKEFIESYVAKYLASDVDVVLGFSQGALIAMKVINDTWASARLKDIKAAIFVASPNVTEVQKKELPTLHIIASADDVVDMEDSLEMAARFVKPVIVEHAGGHMDFPMLAKKSIRSLLEAVSANIDRE